VESLQAFINAVEAFAARLAAVDLRLLALAAGLGALNLALRARGWQNILRAALPDLTVRYRSALGAYYGGAGVNAIIPARVGDLVRILLIRRGVPGAPYPLLAGTMVAETVFDIFTGGLLLAWVLWAGLLPGVRLPDIPAFDLSLAARHPWLTVLIASVLVVLLIVTGRRVRRFWLTLGRGLIILRSPGRFVGTVVVWQALGWVCRLAAAYLFLGAFGIPQSLQNALLVLVAGTLGGLFPATPAGLGPKQALAVVVLAGEASRSAVLAFSAGMELTIVVVNVAIGAVCIALIMGSLRWRQVIGEARAQEGAHEGAQGGRGGPGDGSSGPGSPAPEP
jgi:uncharacterized membrane protein YbhN (UPF0104 family)